MIRFVLLTFLLTASALRTVYGQETIYLANGNRSIGKLTGAEGEKIKITVNREGGRQSTYALRRENVLLAFANDGRYLIVSTLDPDPAKAQQAIESFNNGAPPRMAHDLLLKANPATIIPGFIGYESDDVVNYKLPAGSAASINKNELIAIFYRNGQHRLLVPPASAVAALNGARADYLRLSTAPAAVAIATPKTDKKSGPVARGSAQKSTGKPKPTAGSAVAKTESVTKPTEPVPEPAPRSVAKEPAPTLSDEQYQQYRANALQKVDEFVAYLNVITNKELDDDKRDKAIEQTLKLFMPDATIDVTSNKRPGVRKYPLKDYLTRLKLVPYASTSIEWNEIQYVSELTQAADGDYYGLITGQQTFTGYADNGHDILYSDVTKKSVKVKLERYVKKTDAGATLKWAVLLGNIGLVTN